MYVRQIARELSLSPGTVSKALRGSTGSVSIETTQLVLDYCHKNGYLSRAESDRILFKMQSEIKGQQLFSVTCYRGMIMYDAVFGSMCEQMQNHNLYPSSYLINGADSINRFPFKQAAAVIILGRIAADIVHVFTERNIPVVLVDSRMPNSNCSAVNSSNQESVSQSVQTLAHLGHKRIAFMCNYEQTPTYTFKQRQAGYFVGLAAAGLPIKDELLLLNISQDYKIADNQFDWSRCLDDLRNLSKRILEINPLPTAVITANDMTAYILRKTLLAHGLRVPEDISIIGYDGQHHLAPASQIPYPPISTWVVNWREMGRDAVDLALDLMISSEATPKYLEVPAVYEDAGTVIPCSKP